MTDPSVTDSDEPRGHEAITIERRTLKAPVSFSGRGLHSGDPVQVVIQPSGKAVEFVDLDTGDRWVADVHNVTDTDRSTTLGGIRTVEHLMSALSGLGVTDAEVQVSGGEIPAMDGSANDFVQAMHEAGVESIGSREIACATGGVQYEDGPVSVSIVSGNGRWSYEYSSKHLWPYSLTYVVEDVGLQYVDRIGCARTFLRADQLESLNPLGLARGLDRSTALIVGSDGFLTGARMQHELVAHKLLDLVGDLYLLGIPARYLDVRSRASGHRTNVAAAKNMASLLGS